MRWSNYSKNFETIFSRQNMFQKGTNPLDKQMWYYLSGLHSAKLKARKMGLEQTLQNTE